MKRTLVEKIDHLLAANKNRKNKEGCCFPGCELPGETLAVGRDEWRGDKKASPMGFYCEIHADSVSDEGSPEYVVSCPCCGCLFGVN